MSTDTTVLSSVERGSVLVRDVIIVVIIVIIIIIIVVT